MPDQPCEQSVSCLWVKVGEKAASSVPPQPVPILCSPSAAQGLLVSLDTGFLAH